MSAKMNFRLIREKKGYTVQDMAELAKVSRATIYNYENAESVPNDKKQVKVSQKILDAYGVTQKYLMMNNNVATSA